MITISAFPNLAEASIAQTYLTDNEIPCMLADQDSYLYSGAGVAIPVRLMAPECHFDRAINLLDSFDASSPDTFDPTVLS